MEEKILEIVLNIQAIQIEMQKEQQEMKEAIKETQKEQQEMKETMQGMQKEQQEMQKEQQKMKNTQLSIIQRLDRLEELRRIDSINIAKILEVQVEQFRKMSY